MSGRTKKIFYFVSDALLFVVLGLGCFFLPIFWRQGGEGQELAESLARSAALLFLFLNLPVLLHECGHLLFGGLAGMRLAEFRFLPFFSRSGKTAMYPGNGKAVKIKFFVFTLGGAAFNFLIGGTLFLLWLFLPYHPALVFCASCSGFVLYEGARALIPAELSDGKTDGAVLYGILKRRPEEEIALRVLTVQGILSKGVFAQIPRPLLFDCPVVREDLPAYFGLCFLRMQYLLAEQDRAAARKELDRLWSLVDEEPSEARKAELLRYEGVFRGDFQAKKQRLHGVQALEESL